MALAVLAACGGQGHMVPRAAMAANTADAAGFAFAQTNGTLLVSRAENPLTYSDGMAAKRAALAYCAGQGAGLNPAAFGRFASGAAWAFDGGCL